MTLRSRRRIFSISGTAGVFLLSVLLNGQTGQTPRPQMSEEVFKNVQILKGIPVDEFMDTMGMFAAALSLNCVDCHTSESVGSWDKFADETALKRTARRMMLMVNTINKDQFGGTRVLTCYTCHRGDLRPKAVPNLAAQYAEHVEDANEVVINRIPGGPTVDQVFAKYIQALGGAQRLAAVTSFTGKGTFIGFETEQTKVPVEVYAKAPSQRTTIVHTRIGDSARVFDGRASWIAAPDRPVALLPLTGGNLEGAKLDAMLSFPAQIKQAFAQWQVSATEIDNHEVQVVQGTNPRQPPVNFYFDESGLLVRVLRLVDTAVGRVPTQTDYSDYREVSGVKMPFRWVVTWTNGQATTELSELQVNVPIDAARLARPAPAPRPQ
ncbi:MAG: photosynthetic reaction center cytochrome c subunit family protein [Acidobacteriota bacterium]